jgi:hypothetical protein
MKEFPPLPPVAEADAPDGGHLWLRELIDGEPFRFRMADPDSGLVAFGDDRRAFDSGAVPLPLRHAARAVRDGLDRDALRAAVDDTGAVTFLGVATTRRAVDYDWERLPPFLGTDIRDGRRERYLAVDRVQQAYERLGLTPANTVAREVRAADFDPETFGPPDSAWYDGPAAGIVVRTKAGGRAVVRYGAVGSGDEDGSGGPAADQPSSAAALVDARVTDAWLDRLCADLTDEGESEGVAVTVEALATRGLERRARETGAIGGGRAFAADAVRPALAERADRYLRDRRG